MSHIMKISKEKKEKLIADIQTYFLKEREEDLGILAAGLILDFFLEKLGPEIYNQGIADSYSFMSEKVEGLLEIQR